MKYLHKVNKSITLLLFLIAISYLPTFAQNTAPVPTTFDILSPSNGVLPLQINHNYGTGTSQNHKIFYGGDFANPRTTGILSGFQGWIDAGSNSALTAMSELVARGNHSKSRLTLGSTEGKDGGFGSVINNLPSGRAVGSFDPDDLGDGAATTLNYSGMNGFIAVNEEDTLTIRLSGYIDPNNRLVYSVSEDYSGAMLKSKFYAFDIGAPANDSANGVRFGVIPSTLPAGASFNGSILTWVPNFIQGDGTFDNSVRNNIFFIDANISNGSTVKEATLNTTHDTVYNATWVGQGKGELRDSLYVVYFSATDDGIPPKTGIDSLFILVNDSIANPPPVFTSRQIINRQGLAVSYLRNSVHFKSSTSDSLLRYSEGDSLVITFYATDQDSIRGGGTNQRLTFAVEKWNDFAPSLFTANGTKSFSTAMNAKLDSAAMRADTVFVGGSPRGLRIRLQLAYNIASATPERADSLIIRVTDESSNYRLDTMLFRIANVNRYPIWDADTSTKPADSALVFSYAPETVYPDSVGALQNIAVSSGKTDSVYFSKYTYDPDILIGDQLGTALTFSQSGSIEPIWNGTSGLMVLSLETADTVSYAFIIIVTDNNTTDRKAASRSLFLRVAPTPTVAEIYPHLGYPGQDITIFGSGFGLFSRDTASSSTSRVIFLARNSAGTPQNIQATVNSWSRDRINITIPRSVSESRYDQVHGVYMPDTIQVYSGVFSNPALYPYVIGAADTTTVTEIELVNLSSTSAVVKWKTAFTGGDSVILAVIQDTLDVFTLTAAFQEGSTGLYWPTFVQRDLAGNLTTNKAAIQVFKGSTSGADQIHYIQLTDLTPQTTYQYILGMQSKIFFGDSAHNVNGPYFPKKIDRTNSGAGASEVNRNISGFRFKTLPEQNVNGSTHTITGKVYTTNGAAVNALVTVKIISYASVSDTSMPLTAIVGNDSSWVINLGDAVTDTSGVIDRKFPYNTGDYLLVTVTADKDVGYAQFATTVGSATPQSVNSGINGTRLSASVNYDMRLKTGLNLIGIPVSLFATEPQTSDELLSRMTGGTPTITKYNSATGTQQTRIKAITAGGGYLGDAVFNLELYKAYFVGADQMEYLTLSGSVFADTLPVQIFGGAGLYWISRPAQISSLFHAWSARSMLSNIANASEIFRYNEDAQNYESAIIDPNTGAFLNTDFHIDVSEGYILHITASSQWDINTPTAVLLANADAFFAKASGVTPSIVLDLSKENPVVGSGAVRNVRLSDVTSSAASVSWITEGNSPAEIRYGKVANGLNMVAKFENNMLEGGVRMVQLLGLEPETEYAYEIVSNGITYNNNGHPFTFKSAKVGIGQPYTVFGRLVDDEGKPLARAIVYVELKNENKVSVALADLTDKDGYWNVNLANLKIAGEGTVFEWGAGNDIRITVVFGNNSASYRTKVSGESPQNVVKSGDYELAQEKQEVAPVSLPKAFGLAQNYPNPFNPSTTIAYDIPESNPQGVNVELKVYNLRGQVIRTLVNDMKTPGHFVIQWNGANDNGETVSSGVYFYRIKAGNYVATRKMVLLK